jgi:hypothetical protein
MGSAATRERAGRRLYRIDRRRRAGLWRHFRPAAVLRLDRRPYYRVDHVLVTAVISSAESSASASGSRCLGICGIGPGRDRSGTTAASSPRPSTIELWPASRMRSRQAGLRCFRTPADQDHCQSCSFCGRAANARRTACEMSGSRRSLSPGSGSASSAAMIVRDDHGFRNPQGRRRASRRLRAGRAGMAVRVERPTGLEVRFFRWCFLFRRSRVHMIIEYCSLIL